MVATAEIHALASRLADTESRKRHTRSALDALPDPVLVTDSEARILFANRRAEELFVDDPAGDSGRRRAVEANRLVLGAARASIVAEGPNETPMALVDPEDGADLLFEVFAMSTHDPSAPAHVFVLRDVTHLEAATREMEAQFSRAVAGEIQARVERDWLDAIVQNAAVPIFVMDANTRLQLVNREAARLLEPRPGTAPTSPSIRDVEANHAKLAGFIGELLTHARARREARLVLVDPDGAREFPALAVSTKVLNERGEPAAVVTVLHDLTQELENGNRSPTTVEVTKRNTQLEEQQSALERAARVKNQFLATMSHELRTPINAVLGYNSLLRDGLFGTLTERQQDALARMRSAAEHLLSLINDILDLSRVEAGKLGLSPVVIDWPTFLETLCEPVRPLAATKTLALFVSIEKDLPAICADETRLRQVLLNLLTNAVKFTDHGSVELRVGSNPGSARVQIDVTDTGMGIAETHLETIFDEFTQVDQSSTREHGGAGLGLAISRRLIRFMGGSLTVESTPGRGSTFRVELPALPSAEPELGLGWLGASRTATT
jgi:signal transduction histidine kinase